MENAVLNYFVDSNSSQGYVSLADSNFGGLSNVVVLHDYPSAMMAELIQEICRRAEIENLSVELIHNCLDNSLEGIVLPERSAGMRNIPPYLEESSLALLDDGEIVRAGKCLSEAHRSFAAALKIHDTWEHIYITQMNFEKADILARKTAEKLLNNRSKNGEGNYVHRFFGAATVNGSFDYIENLTQGLQKRWFLKGRPGTGKSTFLRKVAGYIREKGFSAEIYHCAFDPDSLDMIIIRELGFCIFDSTSPHEYFPNRPEDEIIDIYAAAVTPGTDEKNAQALAGFQSAYKQQIAEATESLRQAKLHYDLAQRMCFASVPERRLRDICERLEKKLFDD